MLSHELSNMNIYIYNIKSETYLIPSNQKSRLDLWNEIISKPPAMLTKKAQTALKDCIKYFIDANYEKDYNTKCKSTPSLMTTKTIRITSKV